MSPRSKSHKDAGGHSGGTHGAARSKDFASCLGEFFQRDVITVPIIRRYEHKSIAARCGLRSATIELDTSNYPNIEYIAGNRLSVYPCNPSEDVDVLLHRLIDDITPAAITAGKTLPPPQQGPSSPASLRSTSSHQQSPSSPIQHQPIPAASNPYVRPSVDDVWIKFCRQNGKNSLKLALSYVYDIMAAPSRDLLRIMAEGCGRAEHKNKLLHISRTDEAWQEWICSSLRTLRSTFEEFSSCKPMSAKTVFSELCIQQPRQYSISSIKSSKRFRTEILVIEHKFTTAHIAATLHNIRELDHIQQLDTVSGANVASTNQASINMQQQVQQQQLAAASSQVSALRPKHVPRVRGPGSPGPATTVARVAMGAPITNARIEASNTTSIRSLRSVVALNPSPISSQQVMRVPSYTGALMSQYHANSLGTPNSQSAGKSLGSNASLAALTKGRKHIASVKSYADLVKVTHDMESPADAAKNAHTKTIQYDGVCSKYLLGLKEGEHVVCEFVENPRFTLKGNRERPIMMVGQDVGVVAFRPFWQQRTLEHDRAQVFYTLFKDLKAKRFGDMHLVCLTGGKARVEDLFKREIDNAITHKVMTSVSYIHRRPLLNLVDRAAAVKQQEQSTNKTASISATSISSVTRDNTAKTRVAAAAMATASPGRANEHHHHKPSENSFSLDSKELTELGNRIASLLVDHNGCLYTCCDPVMTQAIEILVVEGIARNKNLPRNLIMSWLPKWKGQLVNETSTASRSINAAQSPANGSNSKNNFLFTIENPFENAQIVQEIYDSSI